MVVTNWYCAITCKKKKEKKKISHLLQPGYMQTLHGTRVSFRVWCICVLRHWWERHKFT